MAPLRERFLTDGAAVMSNERTLVLLYARLATDLERASSAIDEGRLPDAHFALTNAQEIVSALRVALDESAWVGAGELAEIYDWLSARLVAANVGKDAEAVRACGRVVAPLAAAWSEAYRSVAQGLAT